MPRQHFNKRLEVISCGSLSKIRLVLEEVHLEAQHGSAEKFLFLILSILECLARMVILTL
jgi:hypothetical protein